MWDGSSLYPLQFWVSFQVIRPLIGIRPYFDSSPVLIRLQSDIFYINLALFDFKLTSLRLHFAFTPASFCDFTLLLHFNSRLIAPKSIILLHFT